MKLSLLFCCTFVALALASPARKLDISLRAEAEDRRNNRSYLLVQKDGTYAIEDLTSAKIELRASKDDVILYFYSKANPEEPLVLGVDDIEVLADFKGFDASKPMVFIAHGWNNDHTSAVFNILRPAILENHDVNLFSIEWKGPANSNYITAKYAVTTIGEVAGNFANQIISKWGKKASEFILMGHSLGAHVVGKMGATIDGEVDTIIGLDPASPLFTMANTDDRLDTTDAAFVHIIHTCGGLLGFLEPIGHSDYYPNGGQSQPGCGLDLAGTCAHSRSYQYLAESIRSNGFIGRECSSINDYEYGRCVANAKSKMGGYQVDKGASGTFYLTTNSQEPFGKGDEF